MSKAYDAVLQSGVDAAVDSSEHSHFRHRRGNNDTECERYLGQPGAVEHFVLLRKHKQEHIEFCFNRDRMTFEICASFTEGELQAYEKENNRLTVSSKYYEMQKRFQTECGKACT